MEDFVIMWEEQSLSLLREISELIQVRNNFHKNIEEKLAQWKNCKTQTEEVSNQVFQNLLTLNSNLRYLNQDIIDKQNSFDQLCESLKKFQHFKDTSQMLTTEYKDKLVSNLISITDLTEELKNSLTDFVIDEEQLVRIRD